MSILFWLLIGLSVLATILFLACCRMAKKINALADDPSTGDNI